MTSTYYELNDVHNKIKDLATGSIDLIYTSPPYAITRAEWDKPLRWGELFPEMWRVLKPNGIIILHASMPFTYELLKYEIPKYHYTWIKHISTGFLSAKHQPLRNTEEIFVYYKKKGTYNPQMEGNTITKPRKHKKNGEGYYNILKDTKEMKEGHTGLFPKTALKYNTRLKGGGISRSDELIEYFIKTYSNETDMVLDMTCCNKIVGNVVKKLNRNYIGIDIREIKEK